jgi:hypothetical protein
MDGIALHDFASVFIGAAILFFGTACGSSFVADAISGA